MTRTLVVNADDFGLAIAVNAGIEQAHRHGILTSATLLANGPAFEDAVARAKTMPTLGLGIHLNLLRGKPLSNPSDAAPLLGPDGRMRGTFLSMGRRIWNRRFMEAAEKEYRAQIEACLATGLAFTHTDSEKHHAAWPRLTALIERLSAEYGIPAIRRPAEAVFFSWRHLPRIGLPQLLRATILRGIVRLHTTPLKTTEHFFGQTHIGAMTEDVWTALLENLPQGLTEVMVHPGCADDAEMATATTLMGASWIDAMRPVELNALCAPHLQEILRRKGITLSPFIIPSA